MFTNNVIKTRLIKGFIGTLLFDVTHLIRHGDKICTRYTSQIYSTESIWYQDCPFLIFVHSVACYSLSLLFNKQTKLSHCLKQASPARVFLLFGLALIMSPLQIIDNLVVDCTPI